jgi:uncharacterized protein (TIGR02145 family)
MKKKMFLTAVAAAAIAVGAQAQALTAPAGQAYTIESKSAATAVTPVTYQWFRDNSPIAGATKESYTVPAASAYGDNVQFYRMATAQECAGIAEKKSNTLTITFTGYIVPEGCTLVIDGLCWAAVHIDNLQTFATRADMYTKFDQWNRLTAYSADEPLTPAWNATADTSRTWTVNPCPPNWRIPTKEEYQALLNSGTTWVDANTRGNQLAGRFVGYNHATCSLPGNMSGCVFFPATGCRGSADGEIYFRGINGLSWTSTEDNNNRTNGYYFTFGNTNSSVSSVTKQLAFPIRCVR